MGAIPTNRITNPELGPGEGNFRRIHDDLQRRGQSLANPNESAPGVVRARLARVAGDLIKDEITNDPAGRGYGGMSNGARLAALTSTYRPQFGHAAGYVITGLATSNRRHTLIVTKVGGALADLTALGPLQGKAFIIAGRTFSVLSAPADDTLIVGELAPPPALADIGQIFGAEILPPRLHTVLVGIPHAPNDIDLADLAAAMT